MKTKRRWLLVVSVILLLVPVAIAGVLIGMQIRQDQLDYHLIEAVKRLDEPEMTRLLGQGASPDARDAGPPARTWSEILQRLLHRSPPPTSKDTALILAVRQGGLVTVLRLLATGAKVNATNDRHETALTTALDGRYADIMLALLARGANPNAKSADDPTPLLIRVLRTWPPDDDEGTQLKIVRSMLDNGADIHAVDDEGNTALHSAMMSHEYETAQLLIARGADVNKANLSGDTPLLLLGEYEDDFGVLTALLARGADVSPAHNQGWNVLYWVAEYDNAPAFPKVIRSGLDVNSRDKRGRTPLMYAAAYGGTRVLELLLAHGANVNARDKLGWTALMFAAQCGNLSTVQALLNHGAERQARDHENHWTAEQRANHLGQERTARLLRTGRTLDNRRHEEEAPVHEGWSSASSDHPAHIPVDAHRWIEAVRCPDADGAETDRACGAQIVDDSGRRGKPFGSSTFIFPPDVSVFRDADGRRYAFLGAHHRTESNFVAAIRGLALVQKCDYYAEHGAACRPLPNGGALLFGFDSNRDRDGNWADGIPVGHRYDSVEDVSRFRHGVLTSLGSVYLPQQE